MAIVLQVGQQCYGSVERAIGGRGGQSVNKQLSSVVFTSDNAACATIVPNPNDQNPSAWVIKAIAPGFCVVRATDGNSVVGFELVHVQSPAGAYAPVFRLARYESAVAPA